MIKIYDLDLSSPDKIEQDHIDEVDVDRYSRKDSAETLKQLSHWRNWLNEKWFQDINAEQVDDHGA